MIAIFYFYKKKKASEVSACLGGSGMWIRKREGTKGEMPGKKKKKKNPARREKTNPEMHLEQKPRKVSSAKSGDNRAEA